jgi:hypothetical protein
MNFERTLLIILVIVLIAIFLYVYWMNCGIKTCQREEGHLRIAEYIPRAKTGDIVYFSGKGLPSSVVKFFSNSHLTHVGIVIVVDPDEKPNIDNVMFVSFDEPGFIITSLYEIISCGYYSEVIIIPSKNPVMKLEDIIEFQAKTYYKFYNKKDFTKIPFFKYFNDPTWSNEKFEEENNHINNWKENDPQTSTTCAGFFIFFMRNLYGPDDCNSLSNVNPSLVFPIELYEKRIYENLYDYNHPYKFCTPHSTWSEEERKLLYTDSRALTKRFRSDESQRLINRLYLKISEREKQIIAQRSQS